MTIPDSPFFLVVNRYPKKDGQWYKKIGMGINKIYTLMKEMKEIAGISTIVLPRYYDHVYNFSCL